jgi:hypothetical protein
MNRQDDRSTRRVAITVCVAVVIKAGLLLLWMI